MPQPTKGPRLGAGPAHQRLMLAGLATNLFEFGALRTTEAKARRLRPLAERLITKAKRGDLHARRQVLRTVRDDGVVHTLFTDIGPRYANRPGGYTRITKVEPRKGDNAPMAVIELVEPLTAAEEATRATATSAARGTGAALTGGGPAAGDASAADAAPGTTGTTDEVAADEVPTSTDAVVATGEEQGSEASEVAAATEDTAELSATTAEAVEVGDGDENAAGEITGDVTGETATEH